jgi:FKBP-type peptidyl-prolyl cis-trans isomerase
LLAAALVNLGALFRLLFYKRISSKNLGTLSMQTDSNADQAIEFLAENAEKTDVVTTDSGLQYRIITVGSGDLPTTDSVVEVHYVGRLLDGSQFDSSIDQALGHLWVPALGETASE